MAITRIGSVKKPGTYARVTVRSGVVGRGGGVYSSGGQLLSRPTSSTIRSIERSGGQVVDTLEKAEQPEQTQEIEGAVVSESSLRDFQARARAGDPEAVQILKRIGGYIPQEQMTLMAMQNRGEVGGKIITESDAKKMGLNQAQRKLFTIIPDDLTQAQTINLVSSLPPEIRTAKLPSKFKLYTAQPLERYRETERRVSEKIKKVPGVSKVYEKAEDIGVVAGITAPSFVAPGISIMNPLKPRIETQFQAGTTTALIKEPIDRPLKTAVSFGLGYGTTKVGGIVYRTGKIGAGIVKGAGITATSIYGGTKALEIASAESPYEAGKVFGGTLATEVAPFFAGSQLAIYDKILLKKFLGQQKELLRDVEARAGRRTKTKQKEKLVYKRKFGEKSDIELAEDVVSRIEAKYKTGGRKAVEKELIAWSKRVKTPEAKEGFFKFLEILSERGLIRPSVYSTQTGQLSFVDTTYFTAPRKAPPVFVTPKTPKVDSQSFAPLMVGGLGQGGSYYEGSGRFVPEEYQYIEPPPKGAGKDLSGVISGLFSGSALITRPKSKTDFAQAPASATGLATPQKIQQKTKQTPKQVPSILSGIAQKPAQRYATRQVTTFGFTSFTYSWTPKPYKPVPFGGFFFPRRKKERRIRTRVTRSKYLKRIRRMYQPSVGAVTLGVKAKKKPIRLTGLELRPIISKKGKGIKRKKSTYLQNVNKILG